MAEPDGTARGNDLSSGEEGGIKVCFTDTVSTRCDPLRGVGDDNPLRMKMTVNGCALPVRLVPS